MTYKTEQEHTSSIVLLRETERLYVFRTVHIEDMINLIQSLCLLKLKEGEKLHKLNGLTVWLGLVLVWLFGSV